jgi:hypothetical protein
MGNSAESENIYNILIIILTHPGRFSKLVYFAKIRIILKDDLTRVYFAEIRIILQTDLTRVYNAEITGSFCRLT